MPLFMDYHKISHVTVEKVKSAHMADISVQHQYGIKYHQFWVNEASGSVFCLVEGPDRATCERAQQMFYGNVNCALMEVEPRFYNIIMGRDLPREEKLAMAKADEVDLGYRNILLVSVKGVANAHFPRDLGQLLTPKWARKSVAAYFDNYGGRPLKWPLDESQIALFDQVDKAIQCALDIQDTLLEATDQFPKVIFKMGLSAAPSVNKVGDFFSEAIQLAYHLSHGAEDNQIVVSALTGKLCQNLEPFGDDRINRIKCMEPNDEQFLFELLKLMEDKLSDQEFSIAELSKRIGVSRPQLYRKITAITGRAPNSFLRELRLEKARTLLQQKSRNVAQVAYDVGFNSPGYFTRVFKQRYGMLPTTFSK